MLLTGLCLLTDPLLAAPSGRFALRNGMAAGTCYVAVAALPQCLWAQADTRLGFLQGQHRPGALAVGEWAPAPPWF